MDRWEKIEETDCTFWKNVEEGLFSFSEILTNDEFETERELKRDSREFELTGVSEARRYDF